MSDFGDVSVRSQREFLRVVELVRGLVQGASADIAAVLGELSGSAVAAVPGAQYAGVTVVRRRQDIESVCATGRYPIALDEVQRRYGEGPCLSAAWERRGIRVDDLAADERWPRYRGAAIEQTPIRSILSFGLFGDGNTEGALNFYAEKARAFDEESEHVGSLLALHTALVWYMLRRDQQFRAALASREIIGQAKGMLMERFKMDATTAFARLF